MQIPKDGLPGPRVLVGPERTNSVFDVESNKNDKFWKYNTADQKHSATHMTVEYADCATGMRFCRTFFLSALASGQQRYMADVHVT